MKDQIFDPLAPESIANPYASYTYLRERAPAYWHEGMQSWVISRHADCHEVLRNHTVFARDPGRVGKDIPLKAKSIQTEDPPEHLVLRREVMKSLHSQDIRGAAARARQRMAELLADRKGGESFDLMTEVAAPVAMQLINEIAGSSGYEGADYLGVFTGLTRSMDSGLDPSRLAPGRAKGDELRAHVTTWFSAEPARGMVNDLRFNPVVEAAEAEKPMNYVKNTMGGVFNAGFSTTFASIGSITYLLLSNPDLLDRLAHSPDKATAVNELLRYTSPAQATSRIAIEDVVISGQLIEAGSTVVVLMAAANRDPEVFPEPEGIIFDRSPNPHLAFAWGPHVCLGAQLATAWLEELLNLLVEVNPTLKLAGEPEYLDSATLRSLVSLPVVSLSL